MLDKHADCSPLSAKDANTVNSSNHLSLSLTPTSPTKTSYASALVSSATLPTRNDRLSPSHQYKLPILPAESKQLTENQNNVATVTEESSLNKQAFKRPLSHSISENSVRSDLTVNQIKTDTERSKKSVKKQIKKRRVLNEEEIQTRMHSVSSQLESARAHIEASQAYFHLNFNKFVELITKSSMSEASKRKSLALSYLNDSNALLETIQQVYGLVRGTGIRQKPNVS